MSTTARELLGLLLVVLGCFAPIAMHLGGGITKDQAFYIAIVFVAIAMIVICFTPEKSNRKR